MSFNLEFMRACEKLECGGELVIGRIKYRLNDKKLEVFAYNLETGVEEWTESHKSKEEALETYAFMREADYFYGK